MDNTAALLRQVYQTENRVTFPLSGTGSSGMEALLYNILEPGDEVIIGVNGFFGDRMLEMAHRCGATPVPIRAVWGDPIQPARVKIAFNEHPNAKAVAIVHAETSTGVLQPLEEIGQIVRDHGALLIADCVTSLGGVQIDADARLIDAAYSCTQKCLGCPPGLSPITVNDRAWAKITARKRPAQGWYLDLKLLNEYWFGSRAYHHTPPASMIYGLQEGLRVVLEEGLAARQDRHVRNGEALQAGVQAMGLALLANETCRLPMLTTVSVPNDVDDARVRGRLRDQWNIEIGGGLGAMRGQAWRIGLMGAGSTAANVLLLLSALEEALRAEGLPVEAGVGAAAAAEVLSREAA